MPLKKSTGNMYDWVTHMHTHLAGECPHKCKYCYVQTNPHGVSPKYKGEPRLIESELNVNYGISKIIFIEHMNDLFANGIKDEWIGKILNHCWKYPDNKYVFQSKNPERGFNMLYNLFNKNSMNMFKLMFGTTIETNRIVDRYSDAPFSYGRYIAMKDFKNNNVETFITLEPIMDFDVKELSDWIIDLKPNFVNIGADSKHCNLPEPSMNKIYELVTILNKNKIVIKKKRNLERLLR